MLCCRLNLGVSFHGLRHGFASMLLASEVHPTVVQTALGHSSIPVTIDTYSHLLPGMGRDAANKVDTLLRTHIERAPASATEFGGKADREGRTETSNPLRFPT